MNKVSFISRSTRKMLWILRLLCAVATSIAISSQFENDYSREGNILFISSKYLKSKITRKIARTFRLSLIAMYLYIFYMIFYHKITKYDTTQSWSIYIKRSRTWTIYIAAIHFPTLFCTSKLLVYLVRGNIHISYKWCTVQFIDTNRRLHIYCLSKNVS